MVQHLNVNQRKNSTSVIKWFTAVENKTDSIFIKFDMPEIYPSITEDLKNQVIICKRIPKYTRRRYSHNKPLTQVFIVQR